MMEPLVGLRQRRASRKAMREELAKWLMAFAARHGNLTVGDMTPHAQAMAERMVNEGWRKPEVPNV